MKELRRDLNKLRVILCSWIGRLNRVNLLILPKLRFNRIPIKTFASFLKSRYDKLFCMERKRK